MNKVAKGRFREAFTIEAMRLQFLGFGTCVFFMQLHMPSFQGFVSV